MTQGTQSTGDRVSNESQHPVLVGRKTHSFYPANRFLEPGPHHLSFLRLASGLETLGQIPQDVAVLHIDPNGQAEGFLGQFKLYHLPESITSLLPRMVTTSQTISTILGWC